MQPTRSAPPIRLSPPVISRPEPWLGLGPDLRWLFLANLLWSVGLGLYYFTWPVYAAGLGASPVDIGTLYALSFFLATASSAAGGPLADRHDRRTLLLVSWLLSIPAFSAYIVTAAPPGRAAFVFSVVTSSFPLGMLLSPAADGSSAAPARGLAAWWRDAPPAVRGPVLLAAGGTAALNLALPFAPAFLTEVGGLGLGTVGWLGTAAATGAVLSAPALGSVADRAGAGPAAAVALGALALHGLAVVRWSAAPGVLAMAFAAPRETMGRAFALFDVAAGLAGTAAAWVGGWLYRADPGWPFVAAAAAALLLVPAALRLRRQRPRAASR